MSWGDASRTASPFVTIFAWDWIRMFFGLKTAINFMIMKIKGDRGNKKRGKTEKIRTNLQLPLKQMGAEKR